MRRRFRALVVGIAWLRAAGADAAPQIEVVPDGAIAVSGNGCVVMGPEGVRRENGISTALLPDVSSQSHPFAKDMTADASAVLGGAWDFGGPIILRNGGPAVGLNAIPQPNSMRALSDDGQSVVGSQMGWPPHPFQWRNGVFQGLAGFPGVPAAGEAAAVSADGSVAGGWVNDANDQPVAVIWQSGGAPQALGVLPGFPTSEVTALSADGSVAVGISRSADQTQARAFRWQAGALDDLGPLATGAYSVSADGEVVAGIGPDGAFVWDAEHGTRRLADALLADYGVDVGDWQLDQATLVSGDGHTFAGVGRDPDGAQRTWQVRLDEAPCPFAPPVDLLAHQRATRMLELPNGIAMDSQKRVYVAGFDSRNVIRLDASFSSFPPPDAEEVLDLDDGGEPAERPLVLGVGPDDSFYVSAFERRRLIRIAPDGTHSTVFDGSGYPLVGEPMEDPYWPGLPTATYTLAFGPDGTLYLGALARVLRIDPAGDVHELIDILDVAPGGGSFLQGFFQLVLVPGKLLVHDGRRVFALDPVSGDLLGVIDLHNQGMTYLRTMVPDGEGGAWLGGAGLAHLRADGSVEMAFSEFDDPEITGLGEYGRVVTGIAPNGDEVIYTDGIRVVERGPDGSWHLLLHSGTPSVFFRPVGDVFGSLQLSHGVLYWAGTYWTGFSEASGVYRYRIAPPDCANGVDDDGDGVIDFGADPGCVSADDEGEHEAALTCDNGQDDDADGIVDYPADTSCASRIDTELPECSDGLDNDGDLSVDWDGGPHGGPPDPECGGDPMRVIEHPMYCGLGFEAALLLPLYTTLRRWKRPPG
jgi:probable HAF family extracellular repeat protein